jgi:hypothetical protein
VGLAGGQLSGLGGTAAAAAAAAAAGLDSAFTQVTALHILPCLATACHQVLYALLTQFSFI